MNVSLHMQTQLTVTTYHHPQLESLPVISLFNGFVQYEI